MHSGWLSECQSQSGCGQGGGRVHGDEVVSTLEGELGIMQFSWFRCFRCNVGASPS